MHCLVLWYWPDGSCEEQSFDHFPTIKDAPQGAVRADIAMAIDIVQEPMPKVAEMFPKLYQ